MLTDNDERRIPDRSAASEDRVGVRMERVKAALVAEFRKWALPEKDDPRVEAAALRTIDLEFEGLQVRSHKLEGR